MLAEKARFPVSFMCRMLSVSRSGFYAWVARPESLRRRHDRRLVAHIHDVFVSSRSTYGSPRVFAELRALGLSAGRHRVARLMRHEQLRARWRRRFVHTTDSNHHHVPATNLLERRFVPGGPVVIDLCSRRIVGWGMSRRIDTKLVLAALDMALANRQPPKGLLHHSDRGVQYASEDYRSALDRRGIVCSMSRLGNCWDNAPVESFFSTLKTELVHRTTFRTFEEARMKLFEYLEVFYNRRRLHSALGYRSPEAFEAVGT